MAAKFSIKTFGCKVNQYESQLIFDNLKGFGFTPDEHSSADVVIVNTCTVTRTADGKCRQIIRKIKKDNPRAKIIVTGCKAVTPGDIEILGSMEEVFQVVHNNRKNDIPLIVSGLVETHPVSSSLISEISGFEEHARAFVKIQDGCDGACAYCKVRLVRGEPWSRDTTEIIHEIENLIVKGHKEIVITGICIGLWRDSNGHGLPRLFSDLDKIKGDTRFRLSSIEPNHMTDELIDAVSSSKNICHHFHIPMQSGSDRVLRNMKRRYDSERFMRLIGKVRDKMPAAGITTDIICGFPGETADDHFATKEFLRLIAPSRLHVFAYSDREGTIAQKMQEKVIDSEIKKRSVELISLGDGFEKSFAKRSVGKKIEVLVEEKFSKDLLSGYSREYARVILEGFQTDRGNFVTITPEGMFRDTKCLFSSKAQNYHSHR
ncbi:MAG: tRNA (N(6)-L-threonylcarbamoyladenosine(37)-C(2))-methylthiotransferase MtaB [Candidatus Omnitrophica bacterium]|nr:tRNA (N(6)-L-threonylcarbamoyladenosine(37)-C(2))-methylthiotransferase MtaB [Candidatus Omnitrophota bacterium]